VSNEVEKQVPGVPDGYRLVRIGEFRIGDTYLDGLGGVSIAASASSFGGHAIVEPIEPSKPKTEEVVLNKYLLKQGGQWLMIVATAKYVDTYCHEYTFIGPSETVTIEVE